MTVTTSDEQGMATVELVLLTPFALVVLAFLVIAGGEITITVTCAVSLADVTLPGIPGSRTIGSTSTEVIDRFRGVG